MPRGILLVDGVAVKRSGDRYQLTFQSGDAVRSFSLSRGDLDRLAEASWCVLDAAEESDGIVEYRQAKQQAGCRTVLRSVS